jgi:hypothetical protein
MMACPSPANNEIEIASEGLDARNAVILQVDKNGSYRCTCIQCARKEAVSNPGVGIWEKDHLLVLGGYL